MALTIKEEEWAAWKTHRVTQEYLQYLKDRVTMLSSAWAQGYLKDPAAQTEAQHQAETLGDLVNLEFERVQQFYEDEND